MAAGRGVTAGPGASSSSGLAISLHRRTLIAATLAAREVSVPVLRIHLSTQLRATPTEGSPRTPFEEIPDTWFVLCAGCESKNFRALPGIVDDLGRVGTRVGRQLAPQDLGIDFGSPRSARAFVSHSHTVG